MTSYKAFLGIFLCAAAHMGATNAASAVTRQETTVNGLKVWRFVWADSKGWTRTVSLKKQGEGNAGNGGYAVQMTYRYVEGGVSKTATVNAPAGDGFGYFVSHERSRKFSDGATATIAQKIFNRDDSPLGRGFPVTTRAPATGPNKKIIEFKLTYPRYGTIAANGFNANTGEDNPPLGTSANLYRLYNLPVSTTWFFQDGKDYPRILTRVDMTSVPGANRVSFDVRGPYGKLDFDMGNFPMRQVAWADRYYFKTSSVPLTRNSTWTWNILNSRARYVTMIAGKGEFGLLEPVVYSKSAINDGYSLGRGKTSVSYNNGNGCPFQAQKLPCDYEWPYQNAQYELPYNNVNGTTTSEKFAWGSTPLYGMGLASSYDGTQSVPFVGFPANKLIQYHVCVVIGQFAGTGLTRTAATAGGAYNCADTKLN